MDIQGVTLDELRKMKDIEGLVLQGCGGKLHDWVNGINDMLTKSGILQNGSKFEKTYVFVNGDLTCLLFPFKDVQLDIGKLAIWRIQTRENYGSTWLSDYVENKLGGFLTEPQKPKCPLIGQDGNIFNLMGVASNTLKRNGLPDKAKEMCERITSSESYVEALSIIDEYVEITSIDDEQTEDEDFELEMM